MSKVFGNLREIAMSPSRGHTAYTTEKVGTLRGLKVILDGLKLFEKDFKLRTQIEMLLVEWKKMCPSVDVEDQIRWAHFWLQTKVAVNATNMKKDLIKFLSNWMKGEEQRNRERRSGERRAHPKYVEQKPPEEEVMTGEDFQKMREALRSPRPLQ